MHCPEAQMAELARELVQEAFELSRHPYGSSTIQHLLEYTTSAVRAAVVQRLIPEMPLLACSRMAGRVVEKAFNYSSDEEQHSIAMALLQAAEPVSLADVACSRCGSSILEEIANASTHTTEFQLQLASALPRLSQSKFGRRVIASFGVKLTSAGANGMHAAGAAA